MKTLIQILEEAKVLLSREDNDYSWSSWGDEKCAIAEIDSFLEKIRQRQDFDILTLEVWFAPTGPMQEVSLSSGWGQEFVDLADDFDRAIEDYKKK